MGITSICACHTCKKFVYLDKMHTYWRDDKAISFEPEYFDTVDIHYELYYAYLLLRFIFLHQQNECRIDLIPDTEEDRYFYVIKNYEEVAFIEEMF